MVSLHVCRGDGFNRSMAGPDGLLVGVQLGLNNSSEQVTSELMVSLAVASVHSIFEPCVASWRRIGQATATAFDRTGLKQSRLWDAKMEAMRTRARGM